MKKLQITNVHVDHVSHDCSRAAAGFNLGEFRYHVWFDPATLRITGPLYRNTIEPSTKLPFKLNPDSAINRSLLADMWKQIAGRDLIRIALQRDKIERAAEERKRNTNARRRELCEAAIYELETTIDGQPALVLCDEASARVLLPFFRAHTRAPDSVLCRDLVDGSTVACFMPLAEVAS